MMVLPDRSYMVGVVDQNWAAKSQSGLVTRENRPCDVPNLRLINGTVIRGRITTGAERQPLAGQTIVVSESGPPVAANAAGDTRRKSESIDREVDTDADGRFAFRVGPGNYDLIVIQTDDLYLHSDRFAQKVGSEETIDRELHLEDRNDAGLGRITGVVREHARYPVRRRSPAPWLNTWRSSIEHGRSRMAAADSNWTGADRPFRITGGDGKIVLYARSRDGSRSAFTSITPDQRDVAIDLTEAGRVTGEVIDDDGKPLAGRTVELVMYHEAPKYRGLGGDQVKEEVWTDDHGRYTFTGLVVGAYCEVQHLAHSDKPSGFGVFSRDFNVESSVPISLPGLIVPAPATREANANAMGYGGPSLPIKFAAMDRPPTVPAGPSRAEIEALIRTIGRDPITTRLVDRVAARFDPRLWQGDFDYIRRLAALPAFVERMDSLARERFGPASRHHHAPPVRNEL